MVCTSASAAGLSTATAAQFACRTVVRSASCKRSQTTAAAVRSSTTKLAQQTSNPGHPNESRWRAVIGLEVHAQVRAQSKLFSRTTTNLCSVPNAAVSLFDAAIPGTLPLLNRRCVEAAVMTGLSLNCSINLLSSFDRKHYFYPDMPAGYQITQKFRPVAVNGYMDYHVYRIGTGGTDEPPRKRAAVQQVQIEQDSGKSLHDNVRDFSLIDLNRAGIALMEIVTHPDFTSGDEAASFVRDLAVTLRRLKVCTTNMSEGAMRVDANISISPAQSTSKFAQRTEVKNLNSMRFLARAIDYEIDRQISMIEQGRAVGNETRTFDAGTGRTIAMRDKEIVQDYRYMPEPNLPLVRVWDSSIDRRVPVNGVDVHKIRMQQEQNAEKSDDSNSNEPITITRRRKLINDYGLRRDGAFLIADSDKFYEYFQCAVNEPDEQYRPKNPKSVMDILFVEFHAVLQELNIDPTENLSVLETCPIQTWQFTRLVKLTEDLHIAKKSARVFLLHVYTTGDSALDPREYAEKNNLLQMNDRDELRKICDKVLEANSDLVKQITEPEDGQRKSRRPLYEAVLQETNGRANRRFVEEIVRGKLQPLMMKVGKSSVKKS